MVIRSKFSLEEAFKLQQLADGAGSTPGEIVEGIVRLYLGGNIKKPVEEKLPPEAQRLIGAVTAAVERYSRGSKPRPGIGDDVKEKIRVLRRKDGLSLREVADIVGVGPATVHKYS